MSHLSNNPASSPGSTTVLQGVDHISNHQKQSQQDDLHWLTYHGDRLASLPDSGLSALPNRIQNIFKEDKIPLSFSTFLKLQPLSQQKQFAQEISSHPTKYISTFSPSPSEVPGLSATFEAYKSYCKSFVSTAYPRFFLQSHEKRWFTQTFGPTPPPRFKELYTKFMDSLQAKNRLSTMNTFLRWLSPASHLAITSPPAPAPTSTPSAPQPGSWMILLNIPLNSSYFDVRGLAMRSGGFQSLIFLPVHQISMSHAAYVCYNTPEERDTAVSTFHLMHIALSTRDHGTGLRTVPRDNITGPKPALYSTLYAFPWRGQHPSTYALGTTPYSPIGVKQWELGPIALRQFTNRGQRDETQALSIAQAFDKLHLADTPGQGIDKLLALYRSIPPPPSPAEGSHSASSFAALTSFKLITRYLREVYCFDYFTMTQFPSVALLAAQVGDEWHFLDTPDDGCDHPSTPSYPLNNPLSKHLQASFPLTTSQQATLSFFESIITHQSTNNYVSASPAFWKHLDKRAELIISTINENTTTTTPPSLLYTVPNSPLFHPHSYTISTPAITFLSNVVKSIHFIRQRTPCRFQCHVCDKLMVSASKLSAHVSATHGELLQSLVDPLTSTTETLSRYLSRFPEYSHLDLDAATAAPYLFLSIPGHGDYYRDLLESHGQRIPTDSDNKLLQNSRRSTRVLDELDEEWNIHMSTATAVYDDFLALMEGEPQVTFALLQQQRNQDLLAQKQAKLQKTIPAAQSKDTTKDKGKNTPNTKPAPIILTRYADGDNIGSNDIPVVSPEDWDIPCHDDTMDDATTTTTTTTANTHVARFTLQGQSYTASQAAAKLVELGSRRPTNYQGVFTLPPSHNTFADIFSNL